MKRALSATSVPLRRLLCSPLSSAAVSSASLARPAALGPKPNIHRSNAEELVARVPVVEVAGNTAMCDGGGGNMGHPIEYIELNRRAGAEPAACKYCGVRYVRAEGHYH